MADQGDSLQPWTTATTASVTVLAFVMVCLRLLARWERKQKLWWDDWMIVFSMGWNLVVVGFIFAMLKEGMGLHAGTAVPISNQVMIAKFLVVAEILYVFNLVWTKLSILLMYYRIFHFPYFKRWAYIIGIFVVLWVICITFLFIFICVPVQKLWYPDLPGRCINQVGTWIANAVSTIVTDLAILVLPMPQVWKLQLRLSEKIALTVAFSLGFFVVFASAYRFSVLFSYTSADSSYTLAPTVGWTAIEMSAGIVSACLPTLRPALQAIVRILGIQGALPALLRSRTAAMSKTGQSNPSQNELTKGHTGSGVGHSAHSRRHSFYYLPDEADSAGGHPMTPERLDASLRPEYDHGHMVTNVLGSKGRNVDSASDEIPLQGIRVQKDFTQVKE
ncbi:uncharacterized protein NFIA_027930 [Aspergillus fischeri NRRL 181]|uniref:Rhodopsin domain-containing protein n=1 Tax=Neosartorya fischeri (strain ATCC 1020 / DSM 3700 / CBS 544.65 / FGSC A1164 / JCM 1740 / NRRL 181 / WB 181) TaxID=331117 RepID=A1DD09_NEOFI|nr:conserved hypothetical protein [Aspergillus fischeri NRRL 181]EAW19719.1 conserved hypothetical protein [Aspergillus fischeri NRRL 181]KAG2021960.1 hypothetical protein GB937_004514 [Aspergillus fischeri]